MTLNDVLPIVTSFAAALEAIAVAATLIYVIRQTTMTRKSIEELEKESRHAYLSSMSTHVRDINMALLQDKELLQLFSYDKADVLAFMRVGQGLAGYEVVTTWLRKSVTRLRRGRTDEVYYTPSWSRAGYAQRNRGYAGRRGAQRRRFTIGLR